ncbi:staygreen family protein [Fredinandcohnia sp. 179-A 10B2 NHS]|uniref:staygreen family protein n=1 Tax=Fredinandcohnia sp. 179-A 10B2 NHS TaxID=3235176 RepID=UPI00399FF980
MSKFDPNKLSVEFRNGITATSPILQRKYTLTHSDVTGELFLTLGLQYALDKINSQRDEVLGEWRLTNGQYYYHVYLYIGENIDKNTAAFRYSIFKRELPLALKAIRYGDRRLFAAYPHLDFAPIIVTFMSSYPQYNKSENWGHFLTYKI